MLYYMTAKKKNHIRHSSSNLVSNFSLRQQSGLGGWGGGRGAGAHYSQCGMVFWYYPMRRLNLLVTPS